MRAFIEHKGHYGFLGGNPRFILHLDIDFSNEERAIIRARALQDYIFDLSPGFLATTESLHSRNALAVFEIGGIALFLGGILFAFVAAAASIFGPLAFLMLFGGPFLFWYAQYAKSREATAFTKEITVRYLIEHPSISVRALNPAHATALDENLRKRLASLRHFLAQTHELATLREFEP